MINYTISYDDFGDIVINEEIEEIIKSFGFLKQNAKEILDLFIPTKSSFYHSHKTPPVFKNTHLLREAAIYKDKYGVYCPYPYKSKGYLDFWKEQKKRCLEGYTINVDTLFELSITGYHYFLLNFKKMRITRKVDKKVFREIKFPKFYATHYNMFWAFDECQNDGNHLVMLKARGIGASEVFSSIPVLNYTFFTENNFIYAQDEGKLIDDGTFTKINDHLDYLFNETERAFRRLRTGSESNQVLKKRAITRLKSGADKITGGSIEGRVVDREDKARGPRGKFIGWEESGSFKDFIKKIQVARPSVEEDIHTVYGTMVAWGTGGSNNEYVAGLEELFYSPKGWNFKEFTNHWDKALRGQVCGMFVPAYATYPYYMDEDGNVDELRAYLQLLVERTDMAKTVRDIKSVEDKVAEFPFCPQEALLRRTYSPFNLSSVTAQMNYIQANKLESMWVNGLLTRTVTGGIKFHPQKELQRFDDYPVNLKENNKKEGCISILETPLKSDGEVPRNLYTIAVDNYTNDMALSSHSVGACYVFKNDNNMFHRNNLNGNIVAEYVGRPNVIETFWDNIFMLSEYYGNAPINFELRGGGQTAITEARKKKKLHLLANMPSILLPKETNTIDKRLGVVFTEDTKWLAIKYLANWLEEEVEGKIDSNGNITYIKRIQNIYSLGLLKELRNFAEVGNYDRVDAIKLGIMCLKDNEYMERKPTKNKDWIKITNMLMS